MEGISVSEQELILRFDFTRMFIAEEEEEEEEASIVVSIKDVTEHRRAEEALRESESRLKTITQAARDAVIMIDSRGEISFWNPASETMFGYSNDEALGKDLHLLLAPEQYHEEFLKGFEKFRLTGEGAAIGKTLELTAMHKDGHEFPIAISLSAIKIGEEWHAVGIVRDITERKRAEEKIKRQSELLKNALDAVTNPFYIIDVQDFTIVLSNKAAEFDLSKGLLTCYALTHGYSAPCEGNEHPCPLKEVKKTGEPVTVEHIHFNKDGDPRYIEIHAFPIFDEAGNLVQIIEQNVDITERKLAEQALRESQEKLAGIIESIPDYMCIIDEDDNIVWANEALKKTYGADAEGRKCYQVYHRFDHPCENCLLKKTLADGKMHQHEAETIGAKGEKIRQLSIASVASRYPDGRPKTVIEISRDITEQKILEEQFRQSQKMEAVGKLAGGVAHDFNNLLTVIGGNANMAMMALDENDPLRHDLQQVLKATERATRLTGQLLAFSRRQQLQPEVINLNSLVSETEKMLHRVIGEDVMLEAILQEDLWNTKVDSGQFTQILMNLSINARDAMLEGGKLTIETLNVEITNEYCATHPAVVPGDYVMLAVSDTGSGMSEEVKSQIFDPFFTTKGEGEGTGLGLSTVYGIVKQSGGFIYVYSEPGEGSTFKIYLPMIEESVETAREKLLPATKLRGDETILVVEDEEGVRNIAVRILEKFGYKVIEAENGGAGYLKCKNSPKPVDPVITDVVMPEMSGKEFIQSIREFWPEVKVLYMSGYTFNDIARRGVIESKVKFISKPFEPLTFVRKVREVLDS